MTIPKINEEEVALRRINIYKNRHRQFVYVRKWLKKAYLINRDDFRFIGYYQNRIFLVLLTYIFLTVYLNSIWPWPILIAAIVALIIELVFTLSFIKKLSPTKVPDNGINIGFIASALTEERKIVNIKILSYIAIGIVGISLAIFGNYQGFYLIGMYGIGAFGFAQAVFYLYIQDLRKKGTKKHEKI
jgi:MFS family permease